ncbi:MAG: hypothetical protein NDI69_06800 [Bacteriovoracaceae bacterium]|nr:hypothetical protein [Bacteriovoracaceae bacterium]
MNMEKQTINESGLTKSKEYSLWAMFFFGPFYMGYKGFLKEGLVFGLSTTIVSALIVDFVIQPSSENVGIGLIQAINALFYLIAAFKWDDYLVRWNSKACPNKISKLVNLFIVILFILASIIGIMLVENVFYESKLEEAKKIEKSGESSEAMGVYLDLCRKNVGEACLSAGINLADAEMYDKAIKYWAKGCKLDSADACLAAGFWLKEEGNIDASEKYLKKSCSLGKIEACN